jgi:hypothetical protein
MEEFMLVPIVVAVDPAFLPAAIRGAMMGVQAPQVGARANIPCAVAKIDSGAGARGRGLAEDHGQTVHLAVVYQLDCGHPWR